MRLIHLVSWHVCSCSRISKYFQTEIFHWLLLHHAAHWQLIDLCEMKFLASKRVLESYLWLTFTETQQENARCDQPNVEKSWIIHSVWFLVTFCVLEKKYFFSTSVALILRTLSYQLMVSLWRARVYMGKSDVLLGLHQSFLLTRLAPRCWDVCDIQLFVLLITSPWIFHIAALRQVNWGRLKRRSSLLKVGNVYWKQLELELTSEVSKLVKRNLRWSRTMLINDVNDEQNESRIISWKFLYLLFRRQWSVSYTI